MSHPKMRDTATVSVQRLIAGSLVCVQAVAIGFMSGTVVFPAAIAITGIVATISRIRFSPGRDAAFWLLTGSILLFALKYVLFPTQYRFESLAINTGLAIAIAEYLLVLEVAQLFRKEAEDRLPLALPAVAVVVMVCAYDVQVYLYERTIAQVLAVAVIALSAAYLAACRRSLGSKAVREPAGRSALAILVMLTVIAVGWSAASTLYHNERNLDELLLRLLSRTDNLRVGGYSGQARLGDVAFQKSTASNEVALRVVSDSAPGYLRGKAFATFAHSDWLRGAERKVVLPSRNRPIALAHASRKDSVFPIRKQTSETGQVIEVWPGTVPRETLFTPLKASYLKVAVPSIVLDPHGIVEAGALLPGYPYTLLITDDAVRGKMSPALRKQTTELPSDLDRRIVMLADDLFHDCRTTGDKIRVVEHFFRTKFQYQLGIQIPSGKDPLTYFLVNRHPAHCEYFATATAVLLRCAGVPCRYVTGFVVHEKNRYSNNWVAHNRDAHAWVEAWDNADGWVIVESTPDSGVPTAQANSGFAQLRDYLTGWFERFRIQWQRDGLIAVVRSLGEILRGPVGGAALGLTLLGLLIHLIRRRHRRSHDTSSPLLNSLHRLLRRMDGHLKSHKLIRQPGETLHQFADRILNNPNTEFDLRCAVAAWYRNYASIRYVDTTDTIAQEHVKELERTLPF